MTSSIALIRKETDSDFGVAFPDFPGCVTAGRTLDKALRMAVEALGLHIEGTRNDGQTPPSPSLLTDIMQGSASS